MKVLPARREGLLRALRWATALAAGPAWPRAPAQPAAADTAAGAAVPSRHELRTSDGVRLSVLESRPPGSDAASGEPSIVLLPGWCMPAAIWDAQLRALGSRWPTLALDPRGQGLSQVPADGYTADRRADDLHDALQGLGRVVLVGWSLGVLEALQYVHRHGSARLAALALVDNSVGEPPVPPASGFLQELRRDRGATIERFIQAMFRRPPPPALLEQIRDSALRMPLEASIALLSYPLPREHWRSIVHGFDRPLAYIVTPRYREQSQHLREARPQARIEIFEQAGHALFVDEAQRFNRLLADWIERLS
jgi:microsomal epoxide hydrolase